VQEAIGTPTFLTDVYLSVTTFTTLGLGDVTPRTPAARALTALEVALGYGFLAMLVGYLPALYAAYSQREASIAVLYARAGTAPTAAALLEQVGRYESPAALSSYLTEWELWLATLLETHLSHSSLLFYRSQEADQSWLGVLTLVLDVSALVCVGIDGVPSW